MNEEAETKAIEKWLRMVDKPLATKERQKGRRAKRRPKAIGKSGQPNGNR